MNGVVIVILVSSDGPVEVLTSCVFLGKLLSVRFSSLICKLGILPVCIIEDCELIHVKSLQKYLLYSKHTIVSPYLSF